MRTDLTGFARQGKRAQTSNVSGAKNRSAQTRPVKWRIKPYSPKPSRRGRDQSPPSNTCEKAEGTKYKNKRMKDRQTDRQAGRQAFQILKNKTNKTDRQRRI